MATIQEALANATVQMQELNAAVVANGEFIATIKGQVASLQALLESIGNPADIAAAVNELAGTIDAAEQNILAQHAGEGDPENPPAT